MNRNHYCRVDISPERLQLVAKDIEGKVIDEIELGKNWREKEEWKPVKTELASQILPIYQELLSDRTFELRVESEKMPKPGEAVELTLDLEKLPRGPFLRNSSGDGAALSISSSLESPWNIEKQEFLLSERSWKIGAEAPAEVVLKNDRLSPDAAVSIQLRMGEERFESFSTKVKIDYSSAR